MNMQQFSDHLGAAELGLNIQRASTLKKKTNNKKKGVWENETFLFKWRKRQNVSFQPDNYEFEIVPQVFRLVKHSEERSF